MRILIVIPHFFSASGRPSKHGSEGSAAETRRGVVERCLAALHETFGLRHRLAADPVEGQWPMANTDMGAELDVVLCTTGEQHLAGTIRQPLFIHHPVDANPRHLGFVCQRLLRENLGRYDYYGYLEDDIEITDALFFTKLAWFNGQFGHSALLQPNRSEADSLLDPIKAYVDGNLSDRALRTAHQDITVRRYLAAEALGKEWRFQRVDNVHAGCFFLNPVQMSRLAASPLFGTPIEAFIGPLESAATLAIMRGFDVYKPAREQAGFLEVRHLDNRMLLPPPGSL